MKANDGAEGAKRRAGESAADRVHDGAVVGLGTGSTAAHAIRALGRAVDDGTDIRGLPTSHQSRALAREVGIPLTTLDDATPDVAIDGADQAAPLGGADGDDTAAEGLAAADSTVLVKGGGAAHAREKVVAAAADRLLVVVDESKLARQVDRAVPVETLPGATPVVRERIEDLGGEPTLRAAERKDGPVVTDNGNLVLDCGFSADEDPRVLSRQLNGVPGVVAHGLFVGLTAELHVGTEDGVTINEY